MLDTDFAASLQRVKGEDQSYTLCHHHNFMNNLQGGDGEIVLPLLEARNGGQHGQGEASNSHCSPEEPIQLQHQHCKLVTLQLFLISNMEGMNSSSDLLILRSIL